MTDTPYGRSASPLSGAPYSAVELSEDASAVLMLDQRQLPQAETYLSLRSVAEVADGIQQMVVRGAPAIGIAGAYGMTLAAKAAEGAGADAYLRELRRAADLLRATRPTAYNLGWAVARALALGEEHAAEPGQLRWQQLAELGRTIHRQDVEACRAMGQVGAERLADDTTVLTYCNTGALATGGYGTALGVIRGAIAAGKRIKVIAPETRPYLQGARLTAWELMRDGIDVTVITDSTVAHCMQRGLVGAVVVGADRIARNGDVANKIGTYGVATLARAHDIPFYVAAPWSTIDLTTVEGQAIVIEERDPLEIARLGERQLVPEGVSIYNPAFDVTPAHLIREIFTERGAFEPGALAGSS